MPNVNNPSAFPTTGPTDNGFAHQSGMTLLDYFAGIAMQSIFTGPGAQLVADNDSRYDGTNWAEVVAANAYEMGVAMLTDREKWIGPNS